MSKQKTWFVADTHLDHYTTTERNIIIFAKRPFSSIDEMNAVIVNNWNSTVAPNDFVYHLGDFAFSDHTPWLERLHGIKFLIPGNHDTSKRLKEAVGWQAIEAPIKKIKLDGKVIILCHYAMRTWPQSHRGVLHFYGHSHGNLPGDSQSCDVGVDCWNFKPVDLASIMLRMKSHVQRIELDHHRPDK